MPVIPVYDAHEQLDPDTRGMPHADVSQASAQAGVQQGRAIEALGSQISQSGAGLQRAVAKFMPSFDAPVSPDPTDHSPAVTPNAAQPTPAPPTRPIGPEDTIAAPATASPAAATSAPSASTPAPIAAAVPGSTLPVPAASVAGRAQQLQQQSVDFATGLQDDERRQSIQGALDAAATTAPVNGTNLYDTFMKTADEMAEDSFKQMIPGPAKDAAVKQWATEREQWGTKAAALQWKMTGDFSRSALEQIGQNSVSEVKQNPDALDGILATGQQRIATAPGLQPDERASATQQFSRSVLMAGFAAKYPTDPDGLRRALSLDAQNAPLDRTGYSAWLRGLPKEQYDGLMASAQAARDKDPSVSVDHRLQDAYRASVAQQQPSQQQPNAPGGAYIPTDIAASPAVGIGSEATAQSRNPAFSNAVSSGRAGQAMTYFMGQGWNQAQAAGIVGNLLHESGGLNTNARNAGDGADGSTSVGLAQWNGKRAQQLNAFAAARGTAPTDFNTQLAFVQKELTSSESAAGAALRQATNVHDAAAAVALKYERPAGSESGVAENAMGWNNRLRNATALAGGQFPASGPTGSPNARYSALSAQDVQQLIANAEAGRQKAQAQADQTRQVDEQAMAHKVADDVSSIQTTGQGAHDLEAGHVEAMLGPAAADQWAAQRGVALNIFKGTAGMQSMSNGQLADAADRFHPGDDESAPDYGQRAAVYFGVHDRAQQILEQRAYDPADAVKSDVGVMAAYAGALKDRNNMGSLIQARLSAQTALGILPGAQSPITSQEAKDYAAHIVADPVNGSAFVAKDISDHYGRYAAPALARVMTEVTGQRDTGDVVAAALLRARTPAPGPLVTTSEGARLAIGKQADAVAQVTGAPAPVYDNPMGDFMGGSAPQAAPVVAPTRGAGRFIASSATPGGGLKSFGEAIDAVNKDPDRLLPQFIQRFGVARVPANLRDRMQKGAAR